MSRPGSYKLYARPYGEIPNLRPQKPKNLRPRRHVSKLTRQIWAILAEQHVQRQLKMGISEKEARTPWYEENRGLGTRGE